MLAVDTYCSTLAEVAPELAAELRMAHSAVLGLPARSSDQLLDDVIWHTLAEADADKAAELIERHNPWKTTIVFDQIAAGLEAAADQVQRWASSVSSNPGTAALYQAAFAGDVPDDTLHPRTGAPHKRLAVAAAQVCSALINDPEHPKVVARKVAAALAEMASREAADAESVLTFLDRLKSGRHTNRWELCENASELETRGKHSPDGAAVFRAAGQYAEAIMQDALGAASQYEYSRPSLADCAAVWDGVVTGRRQAASARFSRQELDDGVWPAMDAFATMHGVDPATGWVMAGGMGIFAEDDDAEFYVGVCILGHVDVPDDVCCWYVHDDG